MGSASENRDSSNITGLLFGDHMLWIDLLFEVMKKSVGRLGGEFRSVAAMLQQLGNSLLSDWELENVELFW